jgi:hypothetical protein
MQALFGNILDDNMVRDLYEATKGNPLIARLLRNAWQRGELTPVELTNLLTPFERAGLVDRYLRGLDEQAPSVITLNMRAASDCVMEFIARAFPFRHAPSECCARTLFMLADGDVDIVAEREFRASGGYPVAAGLREPLLGLPALAERRRAA